MTAEFDVSDRRVKRTHAELRDTHGATQDDAFAVEYLERIHGLTRRQALAQVSFGTRAGGLHAFHLDRELRNLYLYLFAFGDRPEQFKEPLRALIDQGLEAVFAAQPAQPTKEQALLRLRRCVVEDQALMDRVMIRLVFLGDPAEAPRSELLGKLLEDLESKRFLIDQAFAPRSVKLAIDFASARTGDASPLIVPPRVRTYPLHLTNALTTHPGPAGEVLHLGVVRLSDLLDIRRAMGPRFLERNIRGALSEEKSVNRALVLAFKRIVVDGADDPSVFPFNHNGVALAAEALDLTDAGATVTEPRLLNGAQTIAAFDRFLAGLEGHADYDAYRARARDLQVLCKVITRARNEFVTTVTVNNNRQNPVAPWNLRANDDVQLELADKFRRELGIFYERQERAFDGLSDEDLDELGVAQDKALQLVPLARTFLASDGELARTAALTAVFEDERSYSQVFAPSRLKADSGQILLLYKIQFRLGKLMNEIAEKGPAKYGFITKARTLLWALLCQGVLNDPRLDTLVERFGNDLITSVDYVDHLATLASTRCRPLISSLISEDPYAARLAEGSFGFLRTNEAFKRCLALAAERWGWQMRRLR